MPQADVRFRSGLSALALALWASSLDVAAAPRGFVTVSGQQFAVNGRAFRVAGVNNHYATFGSNQEVQHVLDDAVAMHANVVRIIVGPVIGSQDGKTPTIWNWKSDADSSNLGAHGVFMMSWDDQKREMAVNSGRDGLVRLDFALAEAGRRHLKVIVALLDFWGYMGGAQQISAWHGGADKYTFFAQDEGARADYRKWAQQVITRVNSLTGTEYRNDPTIFSWELMNEPDIQPHALLIDWLGEMSGFVKSLDSNHLVSTGHGNMVNKLADLELPSVDFGTWHGYAGPAGVSVDDMTSLIADYCERGRRAGKPVLLEEFGMAGPEPQRVAAYRKWIDAISQNQDCAGWIVWRLVARQDGGAFPNDHDGYDVKNDGGPLWAELQALARQTDSE